MSFGYGVVLLSLFYVKFVLWLGSVYVIFLDDEFVFGRKCFWIVFVLYGVSFGGSVCAK